MKTEHDQLTNQNEIAVFDDPRNITIGFGRVIWAEATTPRHKAELPAGWVLPGGDRTNDHSEAMRVAEWISEQEKLSRRKF
jgi:tRNA nucleotidyltransferase/poly(A) polymerase